jgi:acetyl esterase/lipase
VKLSRIALSGMLAMALLAFAHAQDPATQASRPQRQRADQFPVPPGVEVIRDIEYARAGGTRLLLDLYLPSAAKTAKTPPALLVWIHGGGWRSGTKDRCPLAHQAARGYAVASVEYRLSPVAPFPAQIEDCKAAIRFLRANAAKYNFDPRRIGVAGSSAGGHLSALLGTSGGVKDLEGDLGHADQSSRVQAVCDFCGPVDLLKLAEHAERLRAAATGTQPREGSGPGTNAQLAVTGLLGGPAAEKKDLAVKANPATYASADDPPFLIIHGENDRLVPLEQSQILHDALKAKGVDVQLIAVPNAGHGMAGGQESLRKAGEFFDTHLKAAGPASRPADQDRVK